VNTQEKVAPDEEGKSNHDDGTGTDLLQGTISVADTSSKETQKETVIGELPLDMELESDKIVKENLVKYSIAAVASSKVDQGAISEMVSAESHIAAKDSHEEDRQTAVETDERAKAFPQTPETKVTTPSTVWSKSQGTLTQEKFRRLGRRNKQKIWKEIQSPLKETGMSVTNANELTWEVVVKFLPAQPEASLKEIITAGDGNVVVVAESSTGKSSHFIHRYPEHEPDKSLENIPVKTCDAAIVSAKNENSMTEITPSANDTVTKPNPVADRDVAVEASTHIDTIATNVGGKSAETTKSDGIPDARSTNKPSEHKGAVAGSTPKVAAEETASLPKLIFSDNVPCAVWVRSIPAPAKLSKPSATGNTKASESQPGSLKSEGDRSQQVKVPKNKSSPTPKSCANKSHGPTNITKSKKAPNADSIKGSQELKVNANVQEAEPVPQTSETYATGPITVWSQSQGALTQEKFGRLGRRNKHKILKEIQSLLKGTGTSVTKSIELTWEVVAKSLPTKPQVFPKDTLSTGDGNDVVFKESSTGKNSHFIYRLSLSNTAYLPELDSDPASNLNDEDGTAQKCNPKTLEDDTALETESRNNIVDFHESNVASLDAADVKREDWEMIAAATPIGPSDPVSDPTCSQIPSVTDPPKAKADEPQSQTDMVSKKPVVTSIADPNDSINLQEKQQAGQNTMQDTLATTDSKVVEVVEVADLTVQETSSRPLNSLPSDQKADPATALTANAQDAPTDGLPFYTNYTLPATLPLPRVEMQHTSRHHGPGVGQDHDITQQTITQDPSSPAVSLSTASTAVPRASTALPKGSTKANKPERSSLNTQEVPVGPIPVEKAVTGYARTELTAASGGSRAQEHHALSLTVDPRSTNNIDAYSARYLKLEFHSTASFQLGNADRQFEIAQADLQSALKTVEIAKDARDRFLEEKQSVISRFEAELQAAREMDQAKIKELEKHVHTKSLAGSLRRRDCFTRLNRESLEFYTKKLSDCRAVVAENEKAAAERKQRL
ncbi:hypothetical protein HDU76_005481, partial [Blyttiomyces sp. JEL0837]